MDENELRKKFKQMFGEDLEEDDKFCRVEVCKSGRRETQWPCLFELGFDENDIAELRADGCLNCLKEIRASIEAQRTEKE